MNQPAKYEARRGKPRLISERTPNEDRQYTDDELEFLKAVEAFKRDNKKPFPKWSDILGVVLALGYRKA